MTNRNGVRFRRFSGAGGNVSASLNDPVKSASIDFQIAFHRECRRPERLDVNRLAIFKGPHMELTGGGIREGTVRPPVDHHSTLSANAFATVVIEFHRAMLFLDQLLVQDT